MNAYFKTLIVFFSISLITLLVYLEFTKHAKIKPLNLACEKTDIIRVKEGLIVQTESEGQVVYVSKRWDMIPVDGKDEVGYWLALCRSPNGRVEIRSAETRKKIREFVIDLHYKKMHGLS